MPIAHSTLHLLNKALDDSRDRHPNCHSNPHMLAVIQRELDELSDEVFKRPTQRDRSLIMAEAIDVAVSAIRMMEETIDVQR